MSTQKPSWWQLFALIPMMAIALYLEANIELSPQGHQIGQFGILLFALFGMASWMRVNAPRLENHEPSRRANVAPERYVLIDLDRLPRELNYQLEESFHAQSIAHSSHEWRNN